MSRASLGWSGIALAMVFCVGAAGVQQRRPPPPPASDGDRVSPSTMPARFRNAPRILVSEATAHDLAPLTVRVTNAGNTNCYQTRWRSDGPQSVTLRVPGDPRKVTLLQLAYDPARRSRYMFYDTGGLARAAIFSASPVDTEGVLSFGFGQMSLSAQEDSSCEIVSASAPIGQDKPWREGDEANAGAALARVEILEESGLPVRGWCLSEGYGGASTSSATRNPSRGARQEWKLSSYVTRDGASIALVLSASADWTDPADGKVYRYFQFGSTDFVDLGKEGADVFRIDAGPAVLHPIEVRVFSEDDWSGCASRAAIKD